LATQRLKTLQEKKESVAKAARRDIATLVERGKIETARIKTESIINEDIHIELLELLELYSEIVFTRFGLIENNNAREPDPGVNEAITGIVYAAHRTEVKELHYVRESFMHRYGRDWSILVMDNVDDRVSTRVLNKVTNDPPTPALVDAYLAEIARGYNVDWIPPLPPNFNPPPEASDLFEPSKSSELGEPSGRSLEASNRDAPSRSTFSRTPPSPPINPLKATGSSKPRSVSSPKPVQPIGPPPYSGKTPDDAEIEKPNSKGDDDEDNDDLLRRFQALSNRK